MPHTMLLLLLALLSSSLGSDITLSSADDFTNFVNNVNSDITYSGDTVYLGSDLSLSDIAKPIGTGSTRQFRGVFDGQGYIIKNLTLRSASYYTGLFGYSEGLTIRNVVLDDSCSMLNTFKGSGYIYVSGIIGWCYASSGECNIENIVNMADITFSGNTSYNLFIGGIAGYISYFTSSSYNVFVKNCVNYGSITDSGTVTNSTYTELGGIVGISTGSLSVKYIQNCLNYGTITHNGTSTNLIIGGIIGISSYTYIENCVSAGKIVTQTTASKDNYVGSIMGQVGSNIHINYCYYTSDVGVSNIKGTGTPLSTTGSPNPLTDANLELVSKLNSNATSCNWSKWFLNENNATVTFKAGDNKELSFSSQVILAPDPVKEGNSFLFWCKDAECTEEFDPEIEPISGATTLYAAWVNNVVTFDFNNGATVDMIFSYNTEITYFNIKKEGYTSFWDNYHELMPARNITVTAQCTPNNYTVTFDMNGGNVSGASKTVVTFDGEYGELPEPKRTGYMFLGWFDENNGRVTNETTVKLPKNHTLYAKWEVNNYTVAFDTNGGNKVVDPIIVTFNEKYGDLPEPNRTGYMFLGWRLANGIEVTNETIVTTPDNHTLYAYWEEVTTQVEIVFNTKDLTKEEIKKIVEQYTNTNFEITGFGDESGEVKVIIEFANKEGAREFVQKFKESGGAMNLIKKIGFDQGNDDSASTMIYPLPFLNAFFL